MAAEAGLLTRCFACHVRWSEGRGGKAGWRWRRWGCPGERPRRSGEASDSECKACSGSGSGSGSPSAGSLPHPIKPPLHAALNSSRPPHTMNTGSVLFPSHSPVSSRPSSTVSSYHDHSNYSFSTDLPQRSSRPPSNGRLAYPHQPFPLNPSPRHYLYPPYAHAPPPPLRPSTMPPPPMFDDPAFSSDPRANPHFAMTSTEHFVPLNPSAANIVSPPKHPIYCPSLSHFALCAYLAKHTPPFPRCLSSLQRRIRACPGCVPKARSQNHLFHTSQTPASCRVRLLS